MGHDSMSAGKLLMRVGRARHVCRRQSEIIYSQRYMQVFPQPSSPNHGGASEQGQCWQKLKAGGGFGRATAKWPSRLAAAGVAKRLSRLRAMGVSKRRENAYTDTHVAVVCFYGRASCTPVRVARTC